MKNTRLISGFTLIEMMIVVALIALLSSIAYPSYQEYVVKTKRAEGKSALMQSMMQQERYFTQNNTYVTFTEATPNGFKYYSGDNSTNSAYTLSAAACGTGIGDCVQITATVRGFTDEKCGNLSLTSAGVKSASGTAPTKCWN